MEEYIKLPMALGLEISKILFSKYGIEPRKNKYGMKSLEYTPDELSQIESYTITNPSRNALEGIEYLRSLKSLTIETLTDKSFKESRNIASISSYDALRINMLPKLKELKVVNQNGIRKIDLSELHNLESIIITENANLEELKLGKQTKLHKFNCFNNKQLDNVSGLNNLIKDNNLDSLLIDLILFGTSISYNSKTYDMDLMTLEKMNNIKECAFIADTYLTPLDAFRFHQQCMDIINSHFKNNMDNIDAIVHVEDYLVKNIMYNPNNSLYGIMNNETNSEGFSRLMQYLLKELGIKSHLVYCLMTDDVISSKFKVNADTVLNIDGYYNLYCDPCADSLEYQIGNPEYLPYTLLNRDEIFRIHTLSLVERNINNNHLLVPRHLIEQCLKGDRSKVV